MISLQPLRADQYKQVAEWEWGPQPDGTDWEKYRSEMDAPQWAHFGLYDAAELIGRVSFERIDMHTMSYHVVTDRHKIHSRALVQVLLKSAGFFFDRGFTRLVVQIPKGKERRAAAILALRCGMKEDRWPDDERHFTLLKSRYLKNG